jgi:secreted trypsin-like serine protease
MRTARICLTLAALAFAASAAPAGAIVNGTADGGLHPEVGALIRFEPLPDGALIECSGTLISPTIFLTAAHCDQGDDEVDITVDENVVGGATHSGTFIPDPAYAENPGDPHADIAVVMLDNAINGVALPQLPAANSLSTRVGKGTQFTSVGYGANVVGQSGGAKTLTYYNDRYYATDTFSSLSSNWLKISQNAAKGNGGTCYGDSGGPNFLGAGRNETNIIAGITITGDTWCGSTNVDLRLDIPSVRDFLAQFVTVP